MANRRNLAKSTIKGIFVFWAIGSVGTSSFADSKDTRASFDHIHSTWTKVLLQNVVQSGPESRVRYAMLKPNRATLDDYLLSLEAVPKAEFDRFTEPEKLAFLINAYNAFTIKLVIDNYPIASIKDAGSFLKSPWKKKFFSLFGKARSLDEIEHEMIRPVFNEPRIHFALVCASLGCPPLRPEAFVGDKLDAQLEALAKTFLVDTSKNRYLSKQKKLELSSIFKWYGDDFRKKYGSAVDFVAARITNVQEEQDAIKSGKIAVTYLEYDWSLNDAK